MDRHVFDRSGATVIGDGHARRGPNYRRFTDDWGAEDTRRRITGAGWSADNGVLGCRADLWPCAGPRAPLVHHRRATLLARDSAQPVPASLWLRKPAWAAVFASNFSQFARISEADAGCGHCASKDGGGDYTRERSSLRPQAYVEESPQHVASATCTLSVSRRVVVDGLWSIAAAFLDVFERAISIRTLRLRFLCRFISHHFTSSGVWGPTRRGSASSIRCPGALPQE